MLRRTAGPPPIVYLSDGTPWEETMTVTLQCLDCGFQFTVTLPRPEASGAVAESISCGHCRCRRWAPAA